MTSLCQVAAMGASSLDAWSMTTPLGHVSDSLRNTRALTNFLSQRLAQWSIHLLIVIWVHPLDTNEPKEQRNIYVGHVTAEDPPRVGWVGLDTRLEVLEEHLHALSSETSHALVLQFSLLVVE
eukprot:GFYU01039081.1.p1 GENE.GFYU01039081.1~~GFYU01039081.1.p1  ORF type:complete len:123 (+),score=0.23 GFYU01039081.1:174-542(+)